MPGQVCVCECVCVSVCVPVLMLMVTLQDGRMMKGRVVCLDRCV